MSLRRVRRAGVLVHALRVAVILITGAEVLGCSRLQSTASALGASASVGESTRLESEAVRLFGQGRYNEAARTAQQALFIKERQLGPRHADVLMLTVFIGRCYFELGRLVDAEALYRRSLVILEAGRDAADDNLLMVQNALAQLHVARGDYAHAETLLQHVLTVRERVHGRDYQGLAVTLQAFGNLHANRGAYRQAESYYLRALGIAEQTDGGASLTVAALLGDLGITYMSLGEYERARSHLERAQALHERDLGPGHPKIAVDGINLGLLHVIQGEHERAGTFLRRALAIEQQAGPDRHLPNLLHNLGLLSFAKGDLERAAALLQRAVKAKQELYGPNHPDVAGMLGNLAFIHWARNAFDRAIQLMSRAVDIRERILPNVLISGTEAEKLEYMTSLNDETAMVLSFHARARRQDADALRLAFEIVLQRKGRILDAVSESLAALRDRLGEDDRAALSELVAARSKLAALLFRASDGDGGQQRAQAEQLEQHIESIQARLAARSVEVRLTSSPIALDRVRQAIPDDAALVEFVRFRPISIRGPRATAARYTAYVIRRVGDPAWVALGDAEPIETAIRRLRTALASPEDASVETAARVLDELVMKPVRTTLGEVKTLLISPDGDLNLIPFSALLAWISTEA
jgi:tetratricopeptide (TPR) repeat protein